CRRSSVWRTSTASSSPLAISRPAWDPRISGICTILTCEPSWPRASSKSSPPDERQAPISKTTVNWRPMCTSGRGSSGPALAATCEKAFSISRRSSLDGVLRSGQVRERGIEDIPQRVAQQREGEDHQRQRQARENRQPWGELEISSGHRLVEHATP